MNNFLFKKCEHDSTQSLRDHNYDSLVASNFLAESKISFLSLLTKKITRSKFYVDYVRPHKILKNTIFFTYCLLIKISDLIFYFYKTRRWFNFVNLNDYLKINEISKVIVCEDTSVETPKPATLPDHCQSYLGHHRNSYSADSIYIAKIDNADVYGKTSTVFFDKNALFHDHINVNDDLIAEEFLGFLKFDTSRKKFHLKKIYYDEPFTIEIAASFTDASSSNYAHWLTEVLPKIAVFCNQDQFQHVPLIVDKLPHSNFIESLSLFAKGRKVYFISENKRVTVKSLYLTSVSGYVPFNRRNQSDVILNGGSFHPYAFNLLRSKIFKEIDKLPKKIYPQKIYISRRLASNKRIKNNSELQDIIYDKGFVTVEIEDLNFLQQAILFNNAKEIICSSGSALTNLIFASSECDIQVPIIKHRYANFSYWQNIACSCGNSVSYIFGDEDLTFLDVHSDFSVDLNSLKKYFTK